MSQTLLPKRFALPVFCSNRISSAAYAKEQFILVLSIAGAASYLGLAVPVAVAVAFRMAVLVEALPADLLAYPTGEARTSSAAGTSETARP